MNEIQVIEIPCGIGGLNFSRAISEFPPEDLRYDENQTFADDTWQKEGGATKINTTAITGSPTIVGLHDFWPNPSTQKLIAATSDGKIVSVVAAGIGDTLKSGLGTNKQTVFVESLGAASTRKLFSFNGYDIPQVTSDGVSCSDLATPPADWTGTNQPTAGVAHNGRLWAFGNANYPHNIYYSTLTDHEDFTGTGCGVLNCYPGEGEKIVAGFSFAGRLFVWKFPRGIYWIDDSSTTASEWKVKRLTRSVGMAGPLGLNQIDNDVIFVSPEGLVHSLSTVQEYGDAKASAILPEKISGFIRERMNISRINWAVAIYYPSKREWHLGHTGAGYSYNNQRLVIDLHDLQNPRYRFSPRDVCESMALRRDSSGLDRPMVGDTAGFVRMLDTTSRNKDGVGYLGKFETADTELMPKGIRRGNLQYIEVIFRPEGTHNLTVDLYLDGQYTQTVALNMGSGIGGALGAFVLDTDTLGGGNVLNTRRRIAGSGRRIRCVGYNSGMNQNYSVASILIGFTPGNERA